jgi:hypothetical protein
MPWTYYDAAGKPVPEKAATFRCREVSVDGSAPAPPGHGSPGAIEYHDVHAIDQPAAQDLQVLRQDEGVVQGACLENEGPGAMTKPSLPKTP